MGPHVAKLTFTKERGNQGAAASANYDEQAEKAGQGRDGAGDHGSRWPEGDTKQEASALESSDCYQETNAEKRAAARSKFKAMEVTMHCSPESDDGTNADTRRAGEK